MPSLSFQSLSKAEWCLFVCLLGDLIDEGSGCREERTGNGHYLSKNAIPKSNHKLNSTLLRNTEVGVRFRFLKAVTVQLLYYRVWRRVVR